jgi:hypothetical protein
MRTEREERDLRQFIFFHERGFVGTPTGRLVDRLQAAKQVTDTAAEQLRDLFRKQHPSLVTAWNRSIVDRLTEEASTPPLLPDEVKANAHARAVAVLGPKRGRWK